MTDFEFNIEIPDTEDEAMLDKLTNKLSDVRIHNSPEGLTVTGKL